jgi:antagonist of KipI
MVTAANRLVGNRPKAAALEFALKGPTLRWRGRTPLRCVVVADRVREVTLAPGERLEGELLHRRAYGYIAVAGGFAAPLIMGGRGTCLPGGFGGLDGRELRQGDRLLVSDAASRDSALGDSVGEDRRPSRGGPRPINAPSQSENLEAGARPLRILPGDRRLSNLSSYHALLEGEWRAGAGNRVGLRLEGPRLSSGALHLSQPIPPGAIQVTGRGQPIVLLRDHPTIGGYPVVAVVVTADLDQCAQLRLGDRVRFARAGRA